MNEYVIILTNAYTWYELGRFVLLLVMAISIPAFISYRYTKNRTISILYLSQPLLFLLIFAGLSYIAEEYFESIRNGYQQIGILIGFLIVQINLIIYSIEYLREKREKIFDPDHVNRRHFQSTSNTIILLIILGASFGFFAPRVLGQVILVTSTSVIITVALSHAIILRLFKDTTKMPSPNSN